MHIYRILSQPGSNNGEPFCKLLFQHVGNACLSPSNTVISPIEHYSGGFKIDSPLSITQCLLETNLSFSVFKVESKGMKSQVIFVKQRKLFGEKNVNGDCFTNRDVLHYLE